MSHPTGALNVELSPRVLESLRIRDMERWWADMGKERPQYAEKICPIATLLTTNPTRTG